ncbi:MAG: substrate-binding domain-containing protein, partial [Methyloligellaceae bacterium]
AQELGLRVPQDISIVGFDDIDLASIVSPRLTTVHVPHRRMGKRAAELLIEMISARTIATSHEIAFEIVDRESLASPGS